MNNVGYKFFWKGPLSQWKKSLFEDENGIMYNCAEQYMMFQKAKLFKDEEIASKIIETKFNPKAVKSLGKKVKNFNQNKWDEEKVEIVSKGNFLKFSQNEDLKKYLLKTNNLILVEASPFDKIWGIGLSESEAMISDPNKWGENLLGKCLMNVREELKAE